MLSLFTHEGRDLAGSTEIANAFKFNTYFVNIGKNLSSQIDQNIDDADYKQYLTSHTAENLRFKCIIEDYTIKVIDNLENKNSSGHDGISNKLLKTIKGDISQSLTIIINQMLTTGIFLDDFKLSKVIPLFKKGDSFLLINYRPISLLPTISKILERVIHDQMYEYFNKFDLLAEQQYGFRKQHSTEYAAVKLIDHVSREMEAGIIPANVYIDLSKAFDTLTFDILLYKLKYYGVTDTANFLGIMLDENLSWKSHIEMVSNKISKVTCILYRLKNVFPESVLFVLYNSLIVSYINYGLLLWGVHFHRLNSLQKKALRFMTNSSYLAHTIPLLIKYGLLNVGDMYKLKLLKFYYKLSYDLLPPYFNNYIEIIEQKPARDLRYQYIHAPLVKRVYAECSPLFQLIKLINSLKNDSNDTILKKNAEKVTHITVLLSMLQDLSSIHMILSVE